MLESLGYEVLPFTNSTQALRFFAQHAQDFDLIIQRSNHARNDGDILLTEIRLLHPSMPVILCSGYSARLDQKKLQESGETYILPKPFSIVELADVTAKALQAAAESQ